MLRKSGGTPSRCSCRCPIGQSHRFLTVPDRTTGQRYRTEEKPDHRSCRCFRHWSAARYPFRVCPSRPCFCHRGVRRWNRRSVCRPWRIGRSSEWCCQTGFRVQDVRRSCRLIVFHDFPRSHVLNCSSSDFSSAKPHCTSCAAVARRPMGCPPNGASCFRMKTESCGSLNGGEGRRGIGRGPECSVRRQA